MSKVLIVSAHPDDEVIGAGGTLLNHRENGDELYWVIITNVFENYGFSKERVTQRQSEIELVAKSLGFSETYKLNFPTMTLSSVSLIEMIPKLSKIFLEVEPEVVYCVNRSDVHSDHRIVFDAVMACTKSFRYPFLKKVLMYECLSETEFAPPLAEQAFLANYFVDISDHIDQKIATAKIYSSELGIHPFPRSMENIRALAHIRGAIAGVRYAEAFQLLKWIEKR